MNPSKFLSHIFLSLSISFFFLSPACAAPPSTGNSVKAESTKALPKYIGNATMTADGTIILDLRAEDPSGSVGHGRFTYPPSHPEYQKILKHLGGLKPGEQKAVPAWKD